MATIRKRGNSYQIRVSCGSDIYGKKIINSMTWKPDEKMTPRQIEKELNKVAVQFEEKVKRGVTTKIDNKIKLHEFCDIYLEMQEKTFAPNTFHNYQKIIENYIIPTLGHLKLVDIIPLHIQKFVNVLSEQNANYNTKSIYLSSSTVKTYFIVLQSIFKFACKKGFLEFNPSSLNNIDMPKAPSIHTNILDDKDITILLDCLEKESFQHKMIIHLALCTGCRRGELVALQWNDILWDKKQIIVSKTAYHVNGKKGIKLPKTTSSNRTIVIPDYILYMLKEYKKYQIEQQLITQIPNPYNMLFTDRYGNYLSVNVLSSWFKYFLKKNNLPYIKFHALRHTSATILLANGTNIKTVSSRLGHSNLSTTNRYVHALIDADIAAAETLGQKLNFEEVGQKWDKRA